MKKIGNRPITEADTDFFFKLQNKNLKKIKKQKKIRKNFGKISENFRDFFFLFFLTKKYVITFSNS